MLVMVSDVLLSWEPVEESSVHRSPAVIFEGAGIQNDAQYSVPVFIICGRFYEVSEMLY